MGNRKKSRVLGNLTMKKDERVKMKEKRKEKREKIAIGRLSYFN